MKRILLIGMAILSIAACREKSNEQKETTTNHPEDQSETQPPQAKTFDINTLPVSNENMGTFPYLSAPESYQYTKEKTKEYEEKLFFYDDSSVLKVGGKYYHAQILAKEGVEFGDTYVVNNYKNAIEKLGGVEIYSGPLNKTYNRVTGEDLPYLKDLYDPLAYKYKQYIIPTPTENIWIELIHGLNTPMIDFTVMREEAMKETISILKANDIQKQLDKKGKAVVYIHFDTDKSTIKPDGEKAINEIFLLLQGNKDLSLSIEGHTDNSGTAAHNQSLAEGRAQAVVKELTAKGIAEIRLKAKGFGSEKPLAANNTDANKAINRRVELIKL